MVIVFQIVLKETEQQPEKISLRLLRFRPDRVVRKISPIVSLLFYYISIKLRTAIFV